MWDVYLYIALLILVAFWWFPPIRTQSHPIVFFDGVCNLCNGFVDFLIRVDRKQVLRVASLQGKTAAEKIEDPVLRQQMNSIVYFADGKIYERSSAFLMIMRSLGGWWVFWSIFWLIPRPIRDAVYDWVGRNRYNFFGKRETCRLPTAEEKKVFLE